jgi:osmoprotectant transport system permease protein
VTARVLTKLVLLSLFAWSTHARASDGSKLVVGSKKFPESVLLAEIFATLLERQGVEVERRVNLGNTAVAFAALRQGNIDLYPEYSGTVLGLLDVDRAEVDRARTRSVVSRELTARFGLFWGPPLGFDNSYGLAMAEQRAAQHGITTLSDLAELSGKGTLSAALSHEFLSREDGYRPLAKRYGLEAEVRGTEHGVSYDLVAAGKVDFIDVYTTEGLIREHDLVVLGDDKSFFPPYDAAFVYGPRIRSHAKALAALAELTGRLDDDRMRALNQRLEV